MSEMTTSEITPACMSSCARCDCSETCYSSGCVLAGVPVCDRALFRRASRCKCSESDRRGCGCSVKREESQQG